MKRPFATAAVMVLALGAAPVTARAPGAPGRPWDLFAAERILAALAPTLRAGALRAPGPLVPSRRPAPVPEPAALVLVAAGVAGLAAARRRI